MLEYNVRFGDPECQVVVPRLTEDLAQILAEAADGRLRTDPSFGVRRHGGGRGCVGGLSGLAPDRRSDRGIGRPPRGSRVSRSSAAGVSSDDADRLVTAGGRVLTVCGRGDDVDAARRVAYDGLAKISWPGIQLPTRHRVTDRRLMMKVAVLMGSASDSEKMAPAGEGLEKFGLEADVRVMSAHRTPEAVAAFARSARERGLCGLHLWRRDGRTSGRGGGGQHDAAGGRSPAVGRRSRRGRCPVFDGPDAEGHPRGDGGDQRSPERGAAWWSRCWPSATSVSPPKLAAHRDAMAAG